jgi:hypothetical protein
LSDLSLFIDSVQDGIHLCFVTQTDPQIIHTDSIITKNSIIAKRHHLWVAKLQIFVFVVRPCILILVPDWIKKNLTPVGRISCNM